jgi:aarF domain-containing kinase
MQALVFADAKAIKENSVKLGAGEDLHALFAGVLTMRPWQRVIDPSPDHLVLDKKTTDYSELQVYMLYNFVPPMVVHGTTVNVTVKMNIIC